MNLLVSIPLEQGNVLRQKPVFHLVARKNVSIPLEQGNVLRLKMQQAKKMTILSQSLWNRAMSYDSSGVIKPCGTRLARATSQLFPRLR